MRINVLFFAHLADLAGSSQRTIEMVEWATVEDVTALLGREDNRFVDSLPTCRVAVNADWANLGDTLNDGDELAFVPPVSGG